MFEPTIEIDPESLRESSVFIRVPTRFVSRLRTGERLPTTLTDTEDKEDRVESETVTVMVQEISKDTECDGDKRSVEEDKSTLSSIKAEHDWLKEGAVWMPDQAKVRAEDDADEEEETSGS